LLKQFENQKGKCFYTGRILEWKGGNGLNRNSLSIDKIIPEKGYIQKNFVLCTHIANSVKLDLSLQEIEEWIPKWYSKIKEHIENE